MQKVEIRVEGLLDPHWSEWLEKLEVFNEDDGPDPAHRSDYQDQATLYRILKKFTDLGLKLIASQGC